MKPILIVDDDESILISLKLLLKSEGISCLACSSPVQAMAAMQRDAFALALVDLNYASDTNSGQEGLSLIAAMLELDENLPIIAMTAWGSIGIAVDAMRRGATDFIEKPWDNNNQLLTRLRAQMQPRKAQQQANRPDAENTPLREQAENQMLVSQSAQMTQVLSIARRLAGSSIPILITGENGTGKSLLANYIHRHSLQSRFPFVSVDMGAISESTFESEMFGHTRGAYTDAKHERIGRVELANQGTLFLDEIANMPLSQQAKILRLVEQRCYEMLGSSHTRHIDVRFISATNADIDRLVCERGFRQDLLYRLNGITLKIPPLRERRADILPLAENVLIRARERYKSPASTFSAAARAALENYQWPGNVRELQHVVERSVLLAQDPCIGEYDLLLTTPIDNTIADISEELTLEEAELRIIQRTLQRHLGNARQAAQALGISRSALYRRLGRQTRS
jgi:DNA-binding NtrC family response regulator